jgi:hypothetical protein
VFCTTAAPEHDPSGFLRQQLNFYSIAFAIVAAISHTWKAHFGRMISISVGGTDRHDRH